MHSMKCYLVVTVILVFTLAGFVNSYAIDSFSDKISNGKVNGELKVWYQTNDNDTENRNIFDKENSIFDAGLNLGYTTGDYNGFNARFNFFAVDDLGAYDNIANNSVHGVNHSNTGSWLGEAYIAYNKQNTTIKVGRQNIKSPLINSDGWAVFPNSFEAIWAQNENIKNTKIIASYITKERTLKSDTFQDFVLDGGFMMGAVNESIPGTVLSGYYYHIKDIADIDSLYFEATTKINKVNLAAQYLYFNPDAFNTDETNAFGFKISSKIGKVSLSGSFSSVDKGTLNAAKFSDNGIKTPLYTASICADADIAGATDTDSFKFTAGFSPIEKLTITGIFGYYDHGSDSSANPNNESTSKELTLKYTGFKDVTIFSAYVNSNHNGVGAWKGCSSADTLNTFRIWVSYKF